MANNYNEFSHLPRGPPVFEKGFGTQLMIGGTNKQQMIAYIEEKARKTLVVDEYNAVVRHMKIVSTNQLIIFLLIFSWRTCQ